MRATFLIAALAASFPAVALEQSLEVPSDRKAQYTVLEKGGSGVERTIVTKRVGSTGTTSYSRRLYNCAEGTVKYLGTGETWEAMENSPAAPDMTPIVPGAIADYVGQEACK